MIFLRCWAPLLSTAWARSECSVVTGLLAAKKRLGQPNTKPAAHLRPGESKPRKTSGEPASRQCLKKNESRAPVQSGKTPLEAAPSWRLELLQRGATHKKHTSPALLLSGGNQRPNGSFGPPKREKKMNKETGLLPGTRASRSLNPVRFQQPRLSELRRNERRQAQAQGLHVPWGGGLTWP